MTTITVSDPRRFSRCFHATVEQIEAAYVKLFGALPASNENPSRIAYVIVGSIGWATAGVYIRRQCRS